MKTPKRGKKLITELLERKYQLFAREQALRYYIANPNPSLSNKEFTEIDLEEVRLQMQETKAAIIGIELWEKERQATKKQHEQSSKGI